MALKYTGNADLWSAQITIFGDGTATTVAIDLSKPPFSIDFATSPPTTIYEATGLPATRTFSLTGNVLTITFNTAPPATSFAPTRGGIPNTLVSVLFAYG